jgi:hypothetical protein
VIKPGWTFPLNDGGQENGLNDPGIETFKDNPLSSLAREILQNSKDAAPDDSKKPVEVHFKLMDLPIDEFPGLKEYRASLEACLSYWKDSPQTVAFFKEAKKMLSGTTVPVLKISDFNTTGLTVGKNGGDRTSAWFRLTKAVGSSEKNAGKLGSFGIGKHAPYACSDLRTVFYGTKDATGAVAFQGVSKLVSHLTPLKKVTQGHGYFGVKNGHKPMLTFDTVPSVFARKQVGADVYIMGFHAYPDWEGKIIKSVIESFFVALHDETLKVKVGKTVLNQLTLPALINKYYAEPDPQFYADEQYAALTSEESHQFENLDFYNLGAVRLRVLLNKDFRGRVAMFRRSGMKIYDKGHFRTPLKFSGVFTVEGAELDSVLRSLEPPSHKAWEPERGADPAKSKALLRNLSNWVNEKVRDLVTGDDLTELDAEGMSQYLPDDIDDSPTGTPQTIEKISVEPKVNLVMRVRTTPRVSTAPNFDPNEPGAGESDDDQPEPSVDHNNGDGTEDPGPPPNIPQGQPKPSGGTSGGAKSIDIKDVRIYCSDPANGTYRLLFEPASDDVAYLRIFVIGEVGSEAAPLKSVSINGAKPITKFSQAGVIGPISLPKGKRAALEVILDNGLRCALGVTAHAS